MNTLGRTFLVLVVVAAVSTLWSPRACAAEGSAVIDAARQSQQAAEQALAAARLRISNEQAQLLAALQEAVNHEDQVRERLVRVQGESKDASAALAARRLQDDHDSQLAAHEIDRALYASGLPQETLTRLRTAPALERLDAALTAIQARLHQLPSRLALRMDQQTVIGRDGRLSAVPVVHLGEARAIALGSDHDHRGLLQDTSDGHGELVVGPSLPAGLIASDGQLTAIPLDVTATTATQGQELHRSLGQWLRAGRFFIWPILLTALCGLAVVVERVIALWRRRVDPARLQAVLALVATHDARAAEGLVAAGLTPLDRVIHAGLLARTRVLEVREAVIEQALLIETNQLSRGLPALAVLASIAPLLGLLGTVTGMIDLFTVIAAHGSGNAKSLSGGISEALICTQAGMLVAIPLLIAHAWLGRIADRSSQALEEAACGVLGVAAPESAGAMPTPSVSTGIPVQP